mgnify:CR=1 FL=1
MGTEAVREDHFSVWKTDTQIIVGYGIDDTLSLVSVLVIILFYFS